MIGDLSISGGIRAGLTIGFEDIDDHWPQRRIYDDLYSAPAMGADVAVSCAVTPSASLYLRGSFDRVFQTRGDERSYATVPGEFNGQWENTVASAF
ncbi:hypothetical protein AU467_18425 [Mesorhizobium loti]|uniref:TonB-dependent receptor n=1 Tax=Rhizobium loti TaxID=381 RepID=A0A101KUB0_RHILI|nr:hypothetical protein AU467_18425 [Mesorhizobium loti]